MRGEIGETSAATALPEDEHFELEYGAPLSPPLGRVLAALLVRLDHGTMTAGAEPLAPSRLPSSASSLLRAPPLPGGVRSSRVRAAALTLADLSDPSPLPSGGGGVCAAVKAYARRAAWTLLTALPPATAAPEDDALTNTLAGADERAVDRSSVSQSSADEGLAQGMPAAGTLAFLWRSVETSCSAIASTIEQKPTPAGTTTDPKTTSAALSLLASAVDELTAALRDQTAAAAAAAAGDSGGNARTIAEDDAEATPVALTCASADVLCRTMAAVLTWTDEDRVGESLSVLPPPPASPYLPTSVPPSSFAGGDTSSSSTPVWTTLATLTTALAVVTRHWMDKAMTRRLSPAEARATRLLLHAGLSHADAAPG
eukprot:CAMPEP_0181384314 /NCGR_PEP_ID=MMETSP1106-20121128/21886_1 /TAXON_ID=81844 /ORGANISM="Mantoniella antarctica, Strain SL-175" /LENGTH=370 /DNA_ID=CAMNT_0023504151 /DNA_START=75 /DNA_END=1184 /DNA_ORIENTATION=-